MTYIRGLTVELEKRTKTSYIAVLIKILFEFIRFFKLENVVNNRINFNARQRGAYIFGEAVMYIFYLKVDGPMGL